MNKGKWFVGIMAMTLTFSMAACKSSEGTGETTHVPTTDGEVQETQITTEVTELFYPDELKDTQVIRVEERFRSALENFIANPANAEGIEGGIAMKHFQDHDALVEFLAQFPSEKIEGLAEDYSEAFFGDYDLVLIPRVSHSGSVRHAAEVQKENGRIVVDVTAEVPEIGTADMASWFILVPIPKEMVKDGISVVARMEGSFGAGFGLPQPPGTGTVIR